MSTTPAGSDRQASPINGSGTADDSHNSSLDVGLETDSLAFSMQSVSMQRSESPSDCRGSFASDVEAADGYKLDHQVFHLRLQFIKPLTCMCVSFHLRCSVWPKRMS